jgi:beta-glucosidase
MRSHLLCLLPLSLLLGATGAPPAYRDLNHNGRMDPYEDRSLTPEARADDLIRRMTLEEKVGAMLHATLPGKGGQLGASSQGYDMEALPSLIGDRHMTTFLTRLALPPRQFAEQNNAVQKVAAADRLGIPVTISTDPRSHFQAVLGASTQGGGFSQWPETLGLAALADPERVRRFGDIARQEYRSVGIHMALSPQADLATEPRWPRSTATFGDDPALVSRLVGAYVEGFQHGTRGVARDGVATVVKHWVGYGAEPLGFDGHNHYGRIVRLTNASFALHVAAFQGAFDKGAAGVMPTYPIVTGVTVNGKPTGAVGAGFSNVLLTDLLRGTHRFDGLILSDWAITQDCPEKCSAPTAAKPQDRAAVGMPWGVETLSKMQRFVMGVHAGIDQFGGVDDPAPLLAAVRDGKLSEARIDQSVRRIMILKFRLGLFDNPFVDIDRAGQIVGNPAFQAEADAAQRQALVLLKNKGLPLRAGTKVWALGLSTDALKAAGLKVVADPDAADVILVRASTPSEKLHPYHFFGMRQNEGRLDFRPGDAAYDAIIRAPRHTPVMAVIDMDRPAILTRINRRLDTLIAAFGASDAAVLDVLTGRSKARGRLPLQLPSSMATVDRQDPARPNDASAPLYPRGAGIRRGAPTQQH